MTSDSHRKVIIDKPGEGHIGRSETLSMLLLSQSFQTGACHSHGLHKVTY